MSAHVRTRADKCEGAKPYSKEEYFSSNIRSYLPGKNGLAQCEIGSTISCLLMLSLCFYCSQRGGCTSLGQVQCPCPVTTSPPIAQRDTAAQARVNRAETREFQRRRKILKTSSP